MKLRNPSAWTVRAAITCIAPTEAAQWCRLTAGQPSQLALAGRARLTAPRVIWAARPAATLPVADTLGLGHSPPTYPPTCTPLYHISSACPHSSRCQGDDHQLEEAPARHVREHGPACPEHGQGPASHWRCKSCAAYLARACPRCATRCTC